MSENQVILDDVVVIEFWNTEKKRFNRFSLFCCKGDHETGDANVQSLQVKAPGVYVPSILEL